MMWLAKPIWGQDEPTDTNIWRYFRQSFDVRSSVVSADLWIAVDTTYELWINETFVGRGPARSYPFHVYYDSYSIAHLLRAGERNCIAILVNHLGDHTLSYMRGEPSLLCQMSLTNEHGGIETFVTNDSWRTLRSEAVKSKTPRISFQMEYEEQVDARQEPVGWQRPQFDDSIWEQAVVVQRSWEALERRPIPHLTDDVITPTGIKSVELARIREGYYWSFDVRHLAGTMKKGMKSAPEGERGWLIISDIFAEDECEVQVHGFPNYESIPLRINGQFFEDTSQGCIVTLHRGWNLVMLRSPEFPAVFFKTDAKLQFDASRFVSGAAWVFAGTLNELNGELQRWWTATDLDLLRRYMPLQPIMAQDNLEDIFMLTASQQFFSIDGGFCAAEIALAMPREHLPGLRQIITQREACLHNGLEATTIFQQPDGDIHLVIDFGREVVGYIELEVTASAGTILDANCFEGIDDTGIGWTTNLRNSFRYICKEGYQVFVSHRRRGFRYVSLTLRRIQTSVLIHGVRTHISTYPIEQRGAFRCSDSTLNQIWETAAYTVQLCMLDTYIDCPAYEQVYWVGDARNSALVNNVAFGAHALTTHCIDLAALSLSDAINTIKPAHIQREHLVTSHVVSGWFIEIPMWTFLWVWMVWEQYQYTGDLALLARQYEAVKLCLQRCEKFLSHRDMLAIRDVWNLVDWAAMDLEDEGEVVANTAMMARALDLAAEMATILSQHDETAHFRKLAARLRTALNRYAWSDTHQGYVDTLRDADAYADYLQHMERRMITPLSFDAFRRKQRISECTNTLMLLCQCVPDERYAATLKYVLRAEDGKFRGSGPHETHLMNPSEIVPVGSPWFLFFTLETLFQENKGAVAMKILREQWKRMLDKGATTFWETFPSESVDGRPVRWSRSLCHGWSAAPAYFLSSQVLGVVPLEPGWAKVSIQPQGFDLDWAEGTVPTIHGDIFVRWVKDADGRLDITCRVPNGVEIMSARDQA